MKAKIFWITFLLLAVLFSCSRGVKKNDTIEISGVFSSENLISENGKWYISIEDERIEEGDYKLLFSADGENYEEFSSDGEELILKKGVFKISGGKWTYAGYTYILRITPPIKPKKKRRRLFK